MEAELVLPRLPGVDGQDTGIVAPRRQRLNVRQVSEHSVKEATSGLIPLLADPAPRAIFARPPGGGGDRWRS